MIVDDLNVPGFAIATHKTNSPLIVNSNAALTLAVAAQNLQDDCRAAHAGRLVASPRRSQAGSRGRAVEFTHGWRTRAAAGVFHIIGHSASIPGAEDPGSARQDRAHQGRSARGFARILAPN